MNVSAETVSGIDNESPRVAAVVVLYEPDLKILSELLRSVIGQVATVIVVDNTIGSEESRSPIPHPFSSNVSYYALGDNLGIATAQNYGIKTALQTNHTHVLLMDQDSLLPPSMVNDLLTREQQLKLAGKPVAALGPVFVDVKTGEMSYVIRHSFLFVQKISPSDHRDPIESDTIIASGSLISARAFSAIGLMDERLFIDRVDIEWGLRARALGYYCYICPDIIMQHSLGDTFVTYGGKVINLHSDLRHYYMVRNSVYLLRKQHMGWKWKSVMIARVPLYLLFYSMHSRTPISAFFLLIKAVWHGCKGKLGRID